MRRWEGQEQSGLGCGPTAGPHAATKGRPAATLSIVTLLEQGGGLPDKAQQRAGRAGPGRRPPEPRTDPGDPAARDTELEEGTEEQGRETLRGVAKTGKVSGPTAFPHPSLARSTWTASQVPATARGRARLTSAPAPARQASACACRADTPRP